jgi:formamidopyrimidine-DNA glycosylase
MPELPEVEAIRMQLEKYFSGHSIQKVEIRSPRIFEGDVANVEGASFKEFRRFGKVLSLDLDNEFSLVIHVKMTGQLIYRGPNLKDEPKLSPKVTGGLGGAHTHVVFHLDKDAKVYYNDFRRFGWVKVIRTDDVQKTGLVGKMGPEPLNTLTLEYFEELLRKTRRNIKVLLMDQAKIGGIGNIYANDALWLAKISPKRPANSLSEQEAHALFEAIETVLKKGMETGGASENSFVKPDGTEGEYQNFTLVYARQGTKCERCGTVIQKYMLGGRGTYECPSCQQ